MFVLYIAASHVGGACQLSELRHATGTGTALFRCHGHKTKRAPEQRAPRIIDGSKLQYVKRTRGTNDKSRSRRTLPLPRAITRSGCGPVVRTKKEQVIMESSCPQFEDSETRYSRITGGKQAANRRKTAAHGGAVNRQNAEEKRFYCKDHLESRSGCVRVTRDRGRVSEAAGQNFFRCSS